MIKNLKKIKNYINDNVQYDYLLKYYDLIYTLEYNTQFNYLAVKKYNYNNDNNKIEVTDIYFSQCDDDLQQIPYKEILRNGYSIGRTRIKKLLEYFSNYDY